MLKKLLSSIGIGSAHVDLVLDREDLNDLVKDNSYRMGDTAKGIIYVEGGSVEQEIKQIKVELVVTSRYEQNDSTRFVKDTVAYEFITDTFTIKPGEKREFPFELTIPNGLPVSSLTTKYHFLTNLGIDAALDPTDKDVIEVLPSGILQNFFDAFQELGFYPKGEAYTGRYQIVDFRPTKMLKGQLDELVFQYIPSNTHKEVGGFFELDKKNRGVMGALLDELDLDETKGRFAFSRYELENKEIAVQTIKRFIESKFKKVM